MKYLSLCAIIKNETPYLKEWLEFHKMIGVEHFYIYDNNSTDNPEEFLKTYIEKKEVECTRWGIQPGQLSAYADCIFKHKEDSRWIGFIDIDEFIFPPWGETLSNFLKKYEYASGLVVNWRIFGSSGLDKKPEGLVIENYLKRGLVTNKINYTVKTIANPKCVLRFKNPHFVQMKNGYRYPVNESGLEIPSWESPVNDTDVICVHHYFTKSKEEFAQKIARGRADIRGVKRTLEDFRIHDLNDEKDEKALLYIPELKKRLYAA